MVIQVALMTIHDDSSLMAIGMQLRSRSFSVVDVCGPGTMPNDTGVYAAETQLKLKQISLMLLGDLKAIANGISSEATELWFERQWYFEGNQHLTSICLVVPIEWQLGCS
jgi:hypothetical protein